VLVGAALETASAPTPQQRHVIQDGVCLEEADVAACQTVPFPCCKCQEDLADVQPAVPKGGVSASGRCCRGGLPPSFVLIPG